MLPLRLDRLDSAPVVTTNHLINASCDLAFIRAEAERLLTKDGAIGLRVVNVLALVGKNLVEVTDRVPDNATEVRAAVSARALKPPSKPTDANIGGKIRQLYVSSAQAGMRIYYRTLGELSLHCVRDLDADRGSEAHTRWRLKHAQSLKARTCFERGRRLLSSFAAGTKAMIEAAEAECGTSTAPAGGHVGWLSLVG